MYFIKVLEVKNVLKQYKPEFFAQGEDPGEFPMNEIQEGRMKMLWG